MTLCEGHILPFSKFSEFALIKIKLQQWLAKATLLDGTAFILKLFVYKQEMGIFTVLATGAQLSISVNSNRFTAYPS
jgi:hypothetical protein